MRWEKWNQKEVIGGPGKRWGHSCNAIKGGKLIYVFGGYFGQLNSHTNQVHVFDTDTQMWSEPVIKGTPPTPRDSHTCTTVGDNLFVFGGTDGLKPLGDLHILNTSLNTWISPHLKGDGPQPREGHSAALVGKQLFIFGGCGKSLNNSSEIYYNDLFILNTESFVWRCAKTSGIPPSVRDSHSCSSWKNKIVVIGGEDEQDYYLSDVHILDTDALSWRQLNTSGQLLPPRAGHSSVAFGKHIFVFGGFTDAQNLYDDFYMLDLETGIWTKIMPSGVGPSARFSMSGDCLDPAKSGVLVFIGGCNKNLEALDDMYFFHTELVMDDGRNERRLEKLSLRKQLKLKCQEQHILSPDNDTNMVSFEKSDPKTPICAPYNSQQNQQYFHLNMYRPPVGKRTFQAKVTKNIGNGFTIETIIDGKPLRGILFSTSSPSNLNSLGKKDSENGKSKLNDVRDPNTLFSTPNGSQEIATRDSENFIGANAHNEVNKTNGATTSMDVTTLEDSSVPNVSSVLPQRTGDEVATTERT